MLRTLDRMHEIIQALTAKARCCWKARTTTGHRPGCRASRCRHGVQRANPFPTMSIRENVLAGVRLNNRKISSPMRTIWSNGLAWRQPVERSQGSSDNPGIGLPGSAAGPSIARAVAVHPQVLLMDDVLRSDPISTLAVEDLINELRTTTPS
ncbi:MAG: hypothetical protein ACLUB5_02280 [Bifidobacterium dentium]